MKFVIVGCGRVGATLAENLDRAGHEVVIFDVLTAAFDRLPDTFKGTAIRGDGTDEEVLRQGGTDGADIFLALTEGDNRNIMASQVAAETLGVPKVIAKINDPVRAEAYSSLGLATVCRTNLMVDAVSEYLDLGISTGPGMASPTAAHDHGPDGHPVISGASGARPVARTATHVVLDETSRGRVDGSGDETSASAAPTGEPAALDETPANQQPNGRDRESRGFRFRRG